MSNTINYVFQANLVLLFFLLIESSILKDERSFTLRRLIMLGGMVLAMSLPLLRNIVTSMPKTASNLSVTLAPVTIGYSIEPESLSAWAVIKYVYFLGVILSSFSFMRQLIRLFATLRAPRYRWHRMSVYENKRVAHVFSFFHIIMLGNVQQFSSWEKNKILRHEQVHAQLMHSIDILLISLIQILFWFNPLLIIYKRKLIQLHEFEADARSVQNEEVELYCSLLAKVALQATGITLANHFTQSFTLNRIIMMKTSNKKMQPWKFAISTVATLLFLGAICLYQPAKAQDKDQDQVFTFVDEIPTYPADFIQLLNKELKYPVAAKKNRLEGTTVLSFVIEKDGSMTSAEIKKGFNKECDIEALRAVRALKTKWSPGLKAGKPVRTQMVMPVQFKVS